MNRAEANRGGKAVLSFLDDNYNSDDQKKVLTAALRLLKEGSTESVQLELDFGTLDEENDVA